tara:strand:+ start:813 stop:1910 length:1098 start_codon:yes stop_codon:yes gene_type:complete
MIKNIKILSNQLHIFFDDENYENFPNIWLRDHAKDETNWDPRTSQRKTFTALLDSKLYIKKAEIIEQGKYINVLWSDMDKPVKYSYNFLIKNSLSYKSEKNKVKLWLKNEINEDIFIDFENVISEQGFKFFLKNLYEYGFCVIKNCNPDITSVEKIANKIGYVRNSIFGGLWSFESDKNMADSAYTQEELRPHTDSTYSNDAPGLQLLLCCHYDAEGGESIMVDGFKIADTIKKESQNYFDILSKIEVTGQYIGDGVFLEAKRPIFRLDANKDLLQVSFNNYDRSAFRIKNDLTIKFYDAIKKFDLLANSKEYQWRHILRSGELLIFNNWRVLHGRGSFKGTRKMSGCYINKEDFDSSCRIYNIN